MRVILLFAFSIVFVWPGTSEAGAEWKNNTHLLPSYCKDRAEGKGGRFEKWRNTFGSAFIHIHHYCSGVYAQQKAKSSFKRDRIRLLGQVIGEMNYVSRHCNAGCILYPELHSRLGWALGEKGQHAEAIKHYQLAIEVKPDYTTPYGRLSDLYLKLNQPGEARKVLEAGLKARPGSRKLKKRLKKLEKPK